jgi:hypothetical protein
MNKLKTKRLTALAFALVFFSTLSFSQFNMELLKGGVNDGMKITEAFIAPWANAFTAGLNGGWYNTAKPHKFGGFDITASVNVSFVPSSAETFDLKGLKLQDMKFAAPTASTLAPTIAGADIVGPALYYEKLVGSTPVRVADFRTPAGTAVNYMITPTAQIGIGLPLGTEIKLRYLPKVNVSEYGDISLWGVGLMHSIIQYFPGNKLIPFDVSVFGGYTKLLVNVPISMLPASYTSLTAPYNNAAGFADQGLATTIKAFNASLVASIKLSVFTFYGSLGYIKTNTEVVFKGHYPFPSANTSTFTAEYINANVKTIAPLTIKGFSGVKANIGFRIKLAVFTFNVDYTRAQYNVVSAGLGLSFR